MSSRCAQFALAVGFAVAPAARAQAGMPHIGYVYPAGGRQGTTFTVTLGGQFLNGATNAFVSGDGVQARVTGFTRPLNGKEMTELRDKLKALLDRQNPARTNGAGNRPAGASGRTNAPLGAAERETAAQIRRQLAASQRRLLNPAIAETVTLQIAVAADAAPGDREVRLETADGLSNPLRFGIGQWPEFVRPLLADREEAGPWRPAVFARNAAAAPAPEMRVTLPAVLNGQIAPGGVDRYRFTARRGQRLLVAVSARSLIPYLADAVPGWFQAAVSLADANGHELAFADHYRFHQDPVLFCEVPADGDYVLTIHDTLYRGRDDFVYRIRIGELPFVTDVFPLGGRAGESTTVTLTGWNLPAGTATQIETNREPGVHPVTVRVGNWISDPMPFAVGTLPECREQEPNDDVQHAQRVTLPIVVNGRIERPGDRDVFCFAGRAGDEVVAEVDARRLGSPLDSTLQLTDATGRQLAFNDDHDDKGEGLETHHADSYLRATLPVNGTYYLHLNDAQGHGGAEYAYRLRISAPQPDFALRLVPSSVRVRGGMSVPLTVFALRKDGFTNAIQIELKDAPPGFSLSGNRVPAGRDRIRLTLAAPPAPTRETVCLLLEGRALAQGREIIHPAVPADDLMQAFAYHHLVPAQELAVAVDGRFVVRRAPAILGKVPVRVPAGGSARVLMSLPNRAFLDRFGFAISEAPGGLTLGAVAPTEAGVALELRCDAGRLKPGWEGNVILQLTPRRAAGAARPGPGQGNRRQPSPGALPAIPVEIVIP